nr:hypothetical protein [uncultured Flavobacterium sp.]
MKDEIIFFFLIKKETKKSSLRSLVAQISFRISFALVACGSGLKEMNSLRSNSFSFYVFFKYLTLYCGSYGQIDYGNDNI